MSAGVLEFGQVYRATGEGIPVIEILDKDSKEVLGYLGPFGAYCFQISRTADGVGPIASSGTIGLKHCLIETAKSGNGYWHGVNNEEDITREVLLGQVMIALDQFIRVQLTLTGVLYQMPDPVEVVITDRREYTTYCDFMTKVVEYVRSL